MKLIKRTEKFEVDLNIKLEEQFYQKFLPAVRIVEPLNQFHAQKGATEIIKSYLVIPSRLKKSTYKGETKKLSHLVYYPALLLI